MRQVSSRMDQLTLEELYRRIAGWMGARERCGPPVLTSHFTDTEELTTSAVHWGEFLTVDPGATGGSRATSDLPGWGRTSGTSRRSANRRRSRETIVRGTALDGAPSCAGHHILGRS